jgi:hypothetical protein
VGRVRPSPSACCVLQGRACSLQGKEDTQDFAGLVTALQVLGLSPEDLSAVWAVLATVLQLGNICFSPSEVGEARGHAGWPVVLCTVRAMTIIQASYAGNYKTQPSQKQIDEKTESAVFASFPVPIALSCHR